MTNTKVLKQAFLFQSLANDELETISNLAQERNFSAGEEIFKQGKEAETLHVLLDGRISVRVKDSEETDLMAKTLEESGSVLGSVALVEPYVYNVTAEAVTAGRTLSIEASGLKEAMREDSVMGFKIMSCLSRNYLHRLNVKRTGMISLFKAFKSQTHKSEIYDTYREVA
jgi:CRP-like cAMP-binding protein